ncbi:MAG TPA: 2-dehydropantoate 2-reductase [Acidimicrobiales bacterium]|jgi:2-dehydropantoate 2-reductase
MRFVIYGAGAIGGTIGGRLFEAGHDVTLIARGEHLRALRGEGLTLAAPAGTVTLPIPAVGDPRAAGLAGGDVVVLAMKSQDTGPAVEALVRSAPPDIAVVCAQNGVENERVALRSFPDVYAMSVMLPATHLRPGMVEANSAGAHGLLDLGRYPTGIDATAEAVADALTGGGFVSMARPDIMRWKYRKLILNLANAVEAVCGPAGRQSPLVARVMEEGETVLAAAGIDPVTPAEDAERRADHLPLRRVEGRRREGGSSWQSLTRGLGTIETDYLNGEIVLLARLHGVPAPANALLQRLADEAAAERHPPGSIPPEDVLALLG